MSDGICAGDECKSDYEMCFYAVPATVHLKLLWLTALFGGDNRLDFTEVRILPKFAAIL